jgi:hypothetical protein
MVFDTIAVTTTGFGFFRFGSRAPAQSAAGIKWLFRNSRFCRHSIHCPEAVFTLDLGNRSHLDVVVSYYFSAGSRLRCFRHAIDKVALVRERTVEILRALAHFRQHCE